MKQEEIKEILKLHKLWLDGDPAGVRADFEGANLYNADLRGANLRDANLRSANLVGANLRSADLEGANLVGADLVGADLRGVSLVRADLVHADFRGANLDYSCIPLWCGFRKVNVDINLIRQILAHVMTLRCDDDAFNSIKACIFDEARKSHRASDLGVK